MDSLLTSAAYDLCVEVRDAIGQLANDQGLIDELRRRCPGYTDEQYRGAVAQGMFNSR